MAATFSMIGTIEPFLHCNLKKGDSIYCESNAMVMMESNLELKGQMRGGIMQALMRRFANDESIFQQQIEAVNGEGDCLLAPTLDGDMQILDVGANQYTLSDGAFVAATHSVDLRANIQRNLGGAIFGDTGGFMVMQTQGQGQLQARLCQGGGGRDQAHQTDADRRQDHPPRGRAHPLGLCLPGAQGAHGQQLDGICGRWQQLHPRIQDLPREGRKGVKE